MVKLLVKIVIQTKNSSLELLRNGVALSQPFIYEALKEENKASIR